VRHAEAVPGLRVGDTLPAPGGSPLPAGLFQLAGPSPPSPGQRRRPAAHRDVMPRGHVVLGQAQYRRDPPAREPSPRSTMIAISRIIVPPAPSAQSARHPVRRSSAPAVAASPASRTSQVRKILLTLIPPMPYYTPISA